MDPETDKTDKTDKTERVANEAEDTDSRWIVCLCGNQPDDVGFNYCTKDGMPKMDGVSGGPTPGWDLHEFCLRCLRIHHIFSLLVVGRVDRNKWHVVVERGGQQPDGAEIWRGTLGNYLDDVLPKDVGAAVRELYRDGPTRPVIRFLLKHTKQRLRRLWPGQSTVAFGHTIRLLADFEAYCSKCPHCMAPPRTSL